MNGLPIVVIAEFRAFPGRETYFVERTRSLMREMHAHHGILIHSFHQDEKDPSLFLFYEQYASEEALAAHGAKPEVALWRDELPHMAERLSWRRFSLVDYFRTAEPLP